MSNVIDFPINRMDVVDLIVKLGHILEELAERPMVEYIDKSIFCTNSDKVINCAIALQEAGYAMISMGQGIELDILSKKLGDCDE